LNLVPTERIELPTFGLQNRCTTAVLSGQICIASEGNQTWRQFKKRLINTHPDPTEATL